MFNCCQSSTFKIFSISTEVNQEEISKFVRESFADDSRINISQLIKLCCRSWDIKEYFTIIKKDLPSFDDGAFNTEEEQERQKNDYYKITKSKIFDNIDFGYLIKSKKYKQKIDWIATIGIKPFFCILIDQQRS